MGAIFFIDDEFKRPTFIFSCNGTAAKNNHSSKTDSTVELKTTTQACSNTTNSTQPPNRTITSTALKV
jgi:hypothetical protein